MNLRCIIIIHFLLLPVILLCQPGTGLNKSDQTGKKQGHWIKRYPDNTVMYEGFFKDNNPEGEFKRYFEDGTLRSVLIYSNNGTEAEAKIYHPNGYLSATGRYKNQKKEGLWQFYSEFENSYKVSEELYTGNLRNGISVKLYPDGSVAEKQFFLNDTVQGEWIKYYPNGTICLKSTLASGKINGKFEAWFDNGVQQFSGEYRNDKRNGTWFIYENDGKLRYKLEYINGITKDRQMDIDASDYLDSLEENKGKIPDPEITGPIW
jgi:antitoxin component YwqK of YwqJK toxin-antitoxin module